MIRTIGKTTVLLGLLLLVPAIGLADEEADAKKPGDMDAKEIFRTYCKTCHGPDSDDGEVTPMALIQEQWDEFFEEVLGETHGEIKTEATGEKTLLDFLGEKALDKLHRFCVDHAADSEQPMTCG